MTNEEARQLCRNVHAPKLDAFRETLKTMLTSDLIGHLVDPSSMFKIVDEVPDHFMAAGISVADEIDRRIPVPE